MDAPSTSKNSLIIPGVVAALIVLSIIGVYLYQSNTNKEESTTIPTETNTVTTTSPDSQTVVTTEYQDGTYTATGNYVSPGGPREIEISLTLNGGQITDATFVGGADDPTSKRFQGEFADNYKAMIVGKNLDEVNLNKVAGSSLTPKGFNDAVTKIKTQAQS